jgi:hypothetical protein
MFSFLTSKKQNITSEEDAKLYARLEECINLSPKVLFSNKQNTEPAEKTVCIIQILHIIRKTEHKKQCIEIQLQRTETISPKSYNALQLPKYFFNRYITTLQFVNPVDGNSGNKMVGFGVI